MHRAEGESLSLAIPYRGFYTSRLGGLEAVHDERRGVEDYYGRSNSHLAVGVEHPLAESIGKHEHVGVTRQPTPLVLELTLLL